MPSSTDFAPEEWEAITSLPMKAGILVMWSHETNPLEYLSEVSTLSTAVTDGVESKNSLVRAVAQYHQERNENVQVAAPESLEAAEHFQVAVLDQSRAVSGLLKAKAAPVEAIVYKQWVVGVARRVAESAKEGGFLNFFGGDVSERERETIEQLNDALGLPRH